MMASPQSLTHWSLLPPLGSFRDATSHRIPLQKKPVAEGLVFPLKAGNKPSKDG
jgi:hypothetical protein